MDTGKGGRKLVIVSGASRGIGFALAERLSNTYDVVGFARQEPKEPCNFQFVSGVDVTDKTAVKEFARKIDTANLWGVVACAGIASMNHFLSMPDATRDKIVDVNFHGVANVVEVLGKGLIKNKGGRIIVLSTIAVPLLLEGEAVYAASKSAAETYVKIIANELGEWGVTANLIRPGPTDTDLLAGLTDEQVDAIISKQTLKRKTTFDDLEGICRFFLSDEAALLTGQTLTLGLSG
ncbi:MAG: SDR family oxidoreductase [Rhodospirillales bacterium]|nr:SDR family oxidoreductase [Rhodospirillales bacterium]